MAKNASKALAEQRATEFLSIVLDGAQDWDAIQFVREKEKDASSLWFVGEDATPLAESTIRRYLTRAYKLIESAHERGRSRLFKRHLAQLRSLYARAVGSNEISTARACLKDIADLCRLIPNPAEELRKEVFELKELLTKASANGSTAKTNSPDARSDRADA